MDRGEGGVEETTRSGASGEETPVALSAEDLFERWIQTSRGVVWYHTVMNGGVPRHHFFAIDL